MGVGFYWGHEKKEKKRLRFDRYNGSNSNVAQCVMKVNIQRVVGLIYFTSLFILGVG